MLTSLLIAGLLSQTVAPTPFPPAAGEQVVQVDVSRCLPRVEVPDDDSPDKRNAFWPRRPKTEAPPLTDVITLFSFPKSADEAIRKHYREDRHLLVVIRWATWSDSDNLSYTVKDGAVVFEYIRGEDRPNFRGPKNSYMRVFVLHKSLSWKLVERLPPMPNPKP